MLNFILRLFGLQLVHVRLLEKVFERELFEHAKAKNHTIEFINDNGATGWRSYPPGQQPASRMSKSPENFGQQQRQQSQHPNHPNQGDGKPNRKPQYTNGHHAN